MQNRKNFSFNFSSDVFNKTFIICAQMFEQTIVEVDNVVINAKEKNENENEKE